MRATRLGDICQTTSGGTPSRKRSDFFNGAIPWVKSGELNDGIVLDIEESITEEAIASSSAKIFPAGTLLIALYGATVGRLGILGKPAATNQAVCGIFPPSDLDTKYLFWSLWHRRKDLVAQAVGGAQPNISQTILRNLEIRLPSMERQQLTVAEIEKQFSRLDEAVAGLRRVKVNLKRYKASVLKAAVEGRLVPSEAELARREGRPYETGAELLQRILAERRSRWQGKGKYKEPAQPNTANLSNLPEGWAWTSYESVATLQLGRQRAPKYHHGENMRPYLRVQNVFEDRIDLNDVMEMDFPPSDFKKYRLEPGDLLLNEGQSPELLGRPAIYRGELPGACFTNTLVRLRPFSGLLVEYALVLSRHYMHAGRFLDEGMITTNIAHLSVGRLALIEFPLPPLAEQHRIVAEVDRRLSIVREVEAEVEANLRRAQALRQSVLAKAFGG